MSTQNVLRNITLLIEFTKSKKPAWVSPLAVLLIVELLTVTDEKGQTNVSIEWLCQRTGASRRTVADTLTTLTERDWIVKKSGKQNYDTNTYTVQMDHLPIHHETKSGVISADAHTATWYYHGLVKALPKITTKNGRKRSIRITKNWEMRWGHAAQDWLDEGYDLEHIKDVIDRAFQTKSWSYCHGLHTLKADFMRLLRKASWTVIIGAEDNQFPDGCLFSMK